MQDAAPAEAPVAAKPRRMTQRVRVAEWRVKISIAGIATRNHHRSVCWGRQAGCDPGGAPTGCRRPYYFGTPRGPPVSTCCYQRFGSLPTMVIRCRESFTMSPPRTKVAQHVVDHLAAGADAVGDFLLGEFRRHAQALRGGGRRFSSSATVRS